MIVVYTSPGCASCRKVKQWLKDRNLKFVEKNIFSTILNENEIKHLLMRSENGTEDIISKRSKIVQEQNIDFDEMSLNDLVERAGHGDHHGHGNARQHHEERGRRRDRDGLASVDSDRGGGGDQRRLHPGHRTA